MSTSSIKTRQVNRETPLKEMIVWDRINVVSWGSAVACWVKKFAMTAGTDQLKEVLPNDTNLFMEGLQLLATTLNSLLQQTGMV